MTNSPDTAPNTGPDLPAEPLLDHLAALYAAPVPAQVFTPPARPAGARPSFARRHWRPLGAVAAGLAVITLLAIVPATWGGGAEHVSAQTILDRASAAASGASTPAVSYHLVAVLHVDGKDRAGPVTSETWYQDARNFRIEQSTGNQVVNGEAAHDGQAWLYVRSKGELRVAHGAYDDVLAPVGPQQASSLSEALAKYTGGGCQVPEDRGETTFLGRPAYVVDVVPDLALCAAANTDEARKMQAAAKDLGALTLVVDKQTFVPLKIEQRDATGTPVYTYQVSAFETGAAVSAAIASWAPPPGAVVTDVTSPVEAKQAIAPPGSSRN